MFTIHFSISLAYANFLSCWVLVDPDNQPDLMCGHVEHDLKAVCLPYARLMRLTDSNR